MSTTTWDAMQLTEWEVATEGPKVQDGGKVLKAEVGHMPNCYGGVLASQTFVDGTTILCFSVTTNEYANIAVGVADAFTELAATSGPHAWGLHLGKGRLIQALNAHKISGPFRTLYRSQARGLYKKQLGAGEFLKVVFIIDMHNAQRRLSIAINDEVPSDTGFTIAEGVKPWVWFGGPNCGSVTIERFVEKSESTEMADTINATINKTVKDVPPAPADDGAGVMGLLAATDETVVLTKIPADDAELSPKTVMSHSPPTLAAESVATDRSIGASTNATSRLGDGPATELWTDRAASWLLPLQRAFMGSQEREKEELSA